MPIDSDELDKRFVFHPVQPGQAERYEAIRAKGREFAALVIELTPESREQSLSITSIEEAVYTANAAIARREV